MAGQWVDIPLAAGEGSESPDGDSSDASYVSMAQLVNLQLKPNAPGSRKPFHIASTPTLSTTGVTTPGSGVIRGICFATTLNRVFVVRGTTVHHAQPEASHSWSDLGAGSMTGSLFCRMTDADLTVVSVDGQQAHSFDSSASAALSRDDFSDVTYQDGFTLFTETNTQSVYCSNVDDPTTIGALNFTTADARAGATVGLVSDHRELFVLGTGSIEYYQNIGVGGFPFRRSSPGVVERGAFGVPGSVGGINRAVHTIAKHDNLVFFLGNDHRVYVMRGYQPEPLSTLWVERQIRKQAQLGGTFFGGAFRLDGTLYYFIGPLYDDDDSTLAVTLVCDVDRRLWHARRSPIGAIYPTHVAELPANTDVAPTVLVAAYNGSSSSTLYRLDVDGTNDSGASSQTTRVMTLPTFAPAGGERVFMHELFLDMQAPSTTGTMTVQWSDDGGTTWSTARSGVTTTGGIRWNRLGMFRQRILRFTFEIASKLAIMGVRARIEAAA